MSTTQTFDVEVFGLQVREDNDGPTDFRYDLSIKSRSGKLHLPPAPEGAMPCTIKAGRCQVEVNGVVVQPGATLTLYSTRGEWRP